MWYAVDVALSIFRVTQSSWRTWLIYSVPISVSILPIGPYVSTKCSIIALATTFALLFGTGMATKYLVRSQIIVTAYSLPLFDLGNGPIVSTRTMSNGLAGVGVKTKGSLFFNLDLFRWH